VGKKKPKKQQITKTRSDADLLQAAERASARAKWKDALAAYKELNKRHPGQYDEALTQVQVQRYQAFLESGMYESAEQLLDSLRGQLPPEKLKAFELQQAVALQDQDAIATLTWQTLEQQHAAGQPLDAATLESLIFSESLPTPPMTAHPDVETLLAVRSGLQALCQNEPEPLAAAMAAISRQSPLAHWKLLLRALDAWYSQQDELLDKCLDKLTDQTGAPARIAEGLRLLRQAKAPVTPEALSSALALHDDEASSEVATVAAALLQTDIYLEANRHVEAFILAASTFNFSNAHKSRVEQTVLDRFVTSFKAGGHEALAEHIHRQMKVAHERQPTWFPFLRAQFAAWKLPCDCLECVDVIGKKYLKILASRRASGQVQACAHLHLADYFLIEVRDSHASSWKQRFLDDAIALLQTAMRLDPQSVTAGLLLFTAHTQAGNESVANKLLDQLASAHSDNPKILQIAGNRCIERGALARGIKQLEQALALDPHLPELKSDYLQGLLQKALTDFQKKQYTKGRACFVKMQPYLQESRQNCDYLLDPALMRLRHLELEVAYSGDMAEITKLRTSVESDWQGRKHMHKALEYLFIELLDPGKVKMDIYEEQKIFFTEETLLDQFSTEDVCQLLKIEQGASLHIKSLNWAKSLRQFLDAYRMHYRPECLEGMLAIFWLAIPSHIDLQELLDTCKLWSKADRHHPQLKLLVLFAKLDRDPNDAEEHMVELEQIMKTARQRNDLVALDKGKLLHQQIKTTMAEIRPGFTRHILDGGSEDDLETEFDQNEFENPDSNELQPEFDFHVDDRGDNETDEEYLQRKTPKEVIELLYQQWKKTPYDMRKFFENSVRKQLDTQYATVLIQHFKKLQSDSKA